MEQKETGPNGMEDAEAKMIELIAAEGNVMKGTSTATLEFLLPGGGQTTIVVLVIFMLLLLLGS